ncbi:MAG TPA: DUF6057 family protein [Prolixibacteraceae bacterium]|nr:DUF6057 family protein [Prolixibacteraceae bacterium]
MQLSIRALNNSLLLFLSLLAWWFTASMINPELHYYLQQSAFLTTSAFFEGFTRYPGGIADYLSEFIAQFFYFQTLGSLLIILIASLSGIIAINILHLLVGKIKLSYSIFAFILLLSVLVQINYYYPFYANIRLLLTFGFVWAHTILTSKFPRLSYYNSFILAILLFYLAGGAALIVFAICTIIIQAYLNRKKTDLMVLPLFAFFSAALPYFAYKFLFLVSLPLAYSVTHSKTPEIISYVPDYKLYALYAILPLSVLVAVIFSSIKKKSEASVATKVHSIPGNSMPKKMDNKASKKEQSKPILKEKHSKRKTWNMPGLWLAGQVMMITVLAVVSISYTFDKTKRDKILVSFYGANADWDNVIKTAEGLKEYDIFINLDYNRALANKGKLADHLFNYSQIAGTSGLFIDGKVTSDIPFICSDQYYDLGFMHESQHWAFEAQTIFPNSPRMLKRLVQINLVNGEYQLAEKFLRRLDKNMLYRDWVKEHQKYIEDTSRVAKDPEFSWKRKCEPLDNFTAGNHSQKLSKLLEANPSNKMAFEYLLCSTLLEGDLAKFKNFISQNKNFAQSPLPRAWDEALVVYYYMAKTTPEAEEIAFSPERQKQFVSFIKAIKPFGNDWQMARQSLYREYGNTYWYYLKCLNPKVTNVKIKRGKSDE